MHEKPVKIGRVVPEICSRTDNKNRQTHRYWRITVPDQCADKVQCPQYRPSSINVRRILVRRVNASLPPEAKKIVKI